MTIASLPMRTPRSKQVNRLLEQRKLFLLKVGEGEVYLVTDGTWARQLLDTGYGKAIHVKRLLEKED
tara:strand:- start:184 stop:384 length:201 start_codon:yes stop_codon:yes gene_type:complete